ncbi:High choriolytic enzyme 2 [Folsomia candida]|uniref:Metalloendopeptidase n=1 Tax=Folsomia candida TaxID=158441 RepID=A0A226EIA5_FOLCA|nr:High choriolytic enzyme 2 [Folsomia candida]
MSPKICKLFFVFLIIGVFDYSEAQAKKKAGNGGEKKAVGNKQGNKYKNGPGTTILDPQKKWPKGNVYYELNPSFEDKYHPLLAQAINHIEGRTCLRFRQSKEAKDRIVIKNAGDKSCTSPIGRQGGQQEIVLGKNCNQIKKALNHNHHPSFLALNWFRFFHDIFTESKFAFEKADEKHFGGFGTPYDYKSIMHYGRKGFSKNGKETLIPTKNPKADIGDVDKMSRYDIEDVNNLYCKTVRNACFKSASGGFMNLNAKLAGDGVQVITKPKMNGVTAKWTFEGSDFFGKKGSEIWSWAQTGGGVKVLTENLSKNAVIVASSQGSQNQLWLGMNVGKGKNVKYLVKNFKSGRCLQSTKGNDQLKTVKCNAKAQNQLWTFPTVVP